MIELYLTPTANGLRASVALEETGLPYRAHLVDLAGGFANLRRWGAALAARPGIQCGMNVGK